MASQVSFASSWILIREIMRKSELTQSMRNRADSAGSVSDVVVRKKDQDITDGPSTSFVKRRHFLFLNLTKRSDDATRNSVSLPNSPRRSVFYQPLDPPLRPLR